MQIKRLVSMVLGAGLVLSGFAVQTASAHGLSASAKSDNGLHLGIGHFLKGDAHADASAEAHAKKERRDSDDKGWKFGKFFDKHDGDEDNDKDNDNDRDGIVAVGRVTAVSDSEIDLAGLFGSSKTWEVAIDSDTDFSFRSGADASLDDVEVGDIIVVRGEVTAQSGSSFSVDADSVRDLGADLSIRANLKGEVTSVDEENDTFVVTTKNGNEVTVTTTASTTIRESDGDDGDFADIDVGAMVRVKGWWNSMVNAVTALKVRLL